MLKKLVEKRLAYVSRQILEKYKPEVIAVTGSVGKTTTKEAITTVLRSCFFTRSATKNYNNEIGLPLTIIGTDSPGHSLSGWQDVFKQAKRLLANKTEEYPAMLVLEMGIDRPGDMDYLTDIAKPSRAVLTRLGSAHLEFFSSLDELHAEKLKLAKALSADGMFIYNYEDERLREAAEAIPSPAISYGLSEGAHVTAENVKITFPSDNEEGGVTFKLVYSGSSVPVFIPGLYSRPALLAALAGAAVGFSYDMNALEVAGALKNFKVPAGRLRFFSGIHNSHILDDTYNASPESVVESIETLMSIPRDDYNQSWIVLGDMRELGKDSRQAHEKIGEFVFEKEINNLVTVGTHAEAISEAALKSGMSKENVFHFSASEEAATFLTENIRDCDMIVVKGSQAVRLEKIVKALLARPEDASDIVRQGKDWE